MSKIAIKKGDPGIREMRQLTNKEAKITGLSRFIWFKHEETGILTFWKNCKRGGWSCHVSGDERRMKEKLLYEYWSS